MSDGSGDAQSLDYLYDFGDQSLDYLYDFGDYWEHEVRPMEVTIFNSPLASPWRLDGANACPPGDVDGLPG